MENEKLEISVGDKLPLAKLETYWEPHKARYWYKATGDVWIPGVRDDIIFELSRLGWSTRPSKGAPFSEAYAEAQRIKKEEHISFAGQIAGAMSGLAANGKDRYLVTKSPDLMPATEGDWSEIQTLGAGLFGPTQWEYVLGWCKNAVRGIYNQESRRGQLLVLAGPANCGKSFWQARVITPLLGGRSAKPGMFMMGETSFNEDIIKAEHLVLEDESAKKDFDSRRKFGESIKTFTANATQRLHPKGRDAITVYSKHWMSLSVNEEPTNLCMLPPLDDSLVDKLTLLKCNPYLKDKSEAEMEGYEKLILSQIPAFVHYLLHAHVIRDELQDTRFGVKEYHNPELVGIIQSLSEELVLEMILDGGYPDLSSKGGDLVRTQADIHMELEMSDKVGYRAKKMLTYPTKVGTLLSRLAKMNPDKYIPPKHNDNPRRWTIRWPKPGQEAK